MPLLRQLLPRPISDDAIAARRRIRVPTLCKQDEKKECKLNNPACMRVMMEI